MFIKINNQKQRNPQAGFSLIEVLITVAILAIISTTFGLSFYSWQKSSEINTAANNSVQMLKEIHGRALNGLNNTDWGIHIESDRLVMFSGGTYNPLESTNETTYLSNAVEVTNINLNGGGSDIVFNSSGNTTDYGLGTDSIAFRVENSSDSSSYHDISVTSSGLIEIK